MGVGEETFGFYDGVGDGMGGLLKILKWIAKNSALVGALATIMGVPVAIYFGNTSTDGTSIASSYNKTTIVRDPIIQNSYNNTTIINGLTPEGVALLVKAATAPWQELTQTQRQTIQAHEKQLGVHEGSMQSFFAILKEKNIPSEQWPAKLQEIASRHNALLQQIQTLPKQLREAAAKAIDANSYDEADALLSQSLTVQAKEQTKGQLQMAATWASRGELAMTRLRYTDAAQHFAQAANALPHSQETQRVSYLTQEADAWYSQGDEFGDNPALEQAIQRLTKLLELRPRGTLPLDWAGIQNNLGNALQVLGNRESRTEKLNEAVHAYREALKEYTQKRVPLDWAMTQNNLGNALRNLGERENSTEKLNEAVQAYREALKERTQERVPLDWASTQNNLGVAFETLGEREGGTEKWEAAMTAYQNALKVAEAGGASHYVQLFQSNLQRLRAKLAERQAGK